MTTQPMTYEETLHYTQGMRKQIVGKLTEEGIPTDLDTTKVLLTTLKDMDGTAINDKKVRVEEKNSVSNSEIANAVVKYSKMFNDQSPFFRKPDGSALQQEAAIVEVDPSRLGEHTLVEGEDEIGISLENSRDFMERMQKDKPK